MQRLDLPQALDDIRYKISLIEERLELTSEGLELYAQLAAVETEPLKRFEYKELWMKKREEQISYREQLHSQKVYLHEFELDLENQRKLRQLQLAQMDEHLVSFLETTENVLKQPKNLSVQDRHVLRSVSERFQQNSFRNEDEKISLFRELVTTLQKLTRL